jgi:glutathione S-transferase
MGGCYENGEARQQACKALVDTGPWSSVPEVGYSVAEDSVVGTAIQRVYRHREALVRANKGYSGEGGGQGKDDVDEAVRCALTSMLTGDAVTPPAGTDAALRYVRDRVNVPRDMPIHSAKAFRQALESTAALVGDGHANPIPVKHRRDQSPVEFAHTAAAF